MDTQEELPPSPPSTPPLSPTPPLTEDLSDTTPSTAFSIPGSPLLTSNNIITPEGHTFITLVNELIINTAIRQTRASSRAQSLPASPPASIPRPGSHRHPHQRRRYSIPTLLDHRPTSRPIPRPTTLPPHRRTPIHHIHNPSTLTTTTPPRHRLRTAGKIFAIEVTPGDILITGVTRDVVTEVYPEDPGDVELEEEKGQPVRLDGWVRICWLCKGRRTRKSRLFEGLDEVRVLRRVDEGVEEEEEEMEME